MKNLISLFIFITILTSCGKEETIVEPALADQIAGKYTLSSFDWNGIKVTLPNKNQAGEEIFANITVFRILETKVDLTLNLVTKKTNGNSETITNKFSGLLLKNAATNGIEVYDNTTKVGNILNGSMNLSLQDSQSKFIIIAKKD